MNDRITRREFVRTSAAALSVSALSTPAVARRRGGDTLRVGLIGCGGRGTGAANQALKADDGVVIYALADMFPDRLERCRKGLAKHPAADRVQVPASRCYVGFDAYRQLIDADVDVVLLATPPHFRPAHLDAAVRAGKHVFCEKPMAVDAPGARSIYRSAAEAQRRGLSLVSGFCWRYSMPERATYEKIHAGAIGDIRAMHVTYHTGPIGTQPRRPEWTDMEWQLRNWHHFTWISGDHIVEQACHSIDKINWAMNGVMPVRATAMGGRGVRQGPESGNSYDHFAVIYEYDDGARCFVTCRQQPKCSNDNSDYIFGADGRCFVNGWAPRHEIEGAQPWRYPSDGPRPNMYQVEHDELFASIRNGTPINDGEWMTNSTMMALLGRMAAYTGKTITWDEAMNSTEDLTPSRYDMGEIPVPPIAKPGTTPFT
ncbi:MAG: Gfo/Idh/MocA family oxidoreductase [Planctomycetes bacterium]|nr:Gfo/Idh/MocA family oxidoreductase [Planctomycetota bacterium]